MEIELQAALGLSLPAIKGFASPEVGTVYTRAEQLCLVTGNRPSLSDALTGLWYHHVVRGEVKRALVWILGVAAFVGSLWTGWTFRASNSLNIDLDLIWIRVPNVELWWVLLLAMALGAGLTLLAVGFAWLRGRILLRRYRSMNRRLEKEVHELRSLPLVGSEPGGANLDSIETAEIAPTPVAERG